MAIFVWDCTCYGTRDGHETDADRRLHRQEIVQTGDDDTGRTDWL